MADRNCVLGSYRFFGVDNVDLVLWSHFADCLDDGEACATATTLAGVSGAVEVWEVSRFVARCGAQQ
jgi:hypothetical protein